MIPPRPPALITPADEAKDFQARCAGYSKAKDWKGLEAVARSYAEAHPKDAPSRAALGFALLAQNRIEEGRKACEDAIGADSRFLQAYLYLGLSQAAAGDREGLLKTGERLDKASSSLAADYFFVKDIFCASGKDPALPCAGFKEMKILSQPPMPRYPDMARASGIEGSVCVEVTLGPDGIPTSAKALAGPAQLRAHCERYCMQWRFAPHLVEGHPSPVRFPVRLTLRLDD